MEPFGIVNHRFIAQAHQKDPVSGAQQDADANGIGQHFRAELIAELRVMEVGPDKDPVRGFAHAQRQPVGRRIESLNPAHRPVEKHHAAAGGGFPGAADEFIHSRRGLPCAGNMFNTHLVGASLRRRESSKGRLQE